MVNFATTRERDKKGKFIKPTVFSGFNQKEYCHKYYLKNKSKKLAQTREWAKNNPEKRVVIRARWNKKNRTHKNFLNRLYLYRKKNAQGTVSLEEIKELCSKHPICPYCLMKKPNTIDHVKPLSKGGTNDIENMLPACVSCNSKKGAKTIAKWQPMLYYQFNQVARAQRFNL